jgi:hypothetical protein
VPVIDNRGNFCDNPIEKMFPSAALRVEDMVFLLQPVLHACPVVRGARIVNRLEEVTLLFTAISSIKHTRISEKRTAAFSAPVLSGRQ